MTTVPQTRRGDTIEVRHGHTIADPYRWLEDPDSAETTAWVAAQNAVTEAYLAALPERAWFTATMAAVLRRPRAGVPSERGGRFVVTRNDGSQDQDVWYVADSLAELRAGGRVLLDPNLLSPDGTHALTRLDVSPDGRLALYGVSEGGSDWETLRLLDVATGEPVGDEAIQTKFAEPAWLPDARSFVYNHFAHESAADGTETTALPAAQLRRHRIGQPVEQDDVLIVLPDHPRLIFTSTLTDDDAYLVVALAEGTETRNRLWAFPVAGPDGPDGGSRLGPPVKIVDQPYAEFALAGSVARTLFLRTDLDAERGRLVKVDLDDVTDGRPPLIEVVPEDPGSTLLDVGGAGDGFLAVRLADAQPRLVHYARDGTPGHHWDLPGGAVVGLDAAQGRATAYVGLSSVTAPTTSHRLDLATGEASVLDDLVPGDSAYRPPLTHTRRRRATSRDGTKVPYFLVTPDTDDPTVPRPTLLWGYGGFHIPLLADYRPGWAGWLSAGGRLVIANLRGGGEFGTRWYDEGRLDRKQNVFDDLIAVAEHLHLTGVTTPGQLALHGRSNGGLLVGAALTQRPELFAAAVPGVGVLDMLRFHLFTVGAAWMSDYGDPDDPDQFATALAYSPLHRIEPRAYPATLVLTGDHDDRVVPLHSHKFTATLQHGQTGPAPVLTRIETATGHGAGKPAALVAAEWADLLAFVARHTGLDVPAVGDGVAPAR